MHALYTLLTMAALTLGSPFFAYQAIRHGKYRGSLRQRLGSVPGGIRADMRDSIWLHAVSVGEVLVARGFISALKGRYPGYRMLLSTTTVTGQRLARDVLPEVDGLFYFPLDLPWVVRRVLDAARPRLFISVETELWPGLLHQCRQRGIRTMVVNGRLSARSYEHYRLAGRFFAPVLATIDLICAQSDQAARRFVALGADPRRVIVTGNMKFDAAAALHGSAGPQTGSDVLRYFPVRDRPVFVAASTLRGEEGNVLRAFTRLKNEAPEALLILAPRHPERFEEVTQLVEGTGFSVRRRTSLRPDEPLTADVVVLDTLGELASVFEVATVVFVGGSLVTAGGHNILEPAVCGKPILFGPHMENFAEIAATFLAAKAALQVQSAPELADELVALIRNPERRSRLGDAAREVVAANRGARERTLALVADLLPAGSDLGSSADGPLPNRSRNASVGG